MKYLDHISQVRHYLLFKNKGTRPWGTTVCKIHFTCRGKGPLITFNFKLGHQRILNHVFIIKDHIFMVRRLLKLIQPTVQALVVIHRIGICASLFVFIKSVLLQLGRRLFFSAAAFMLFLAPEVFNLNYILSFKCDIFLLIFFLIIKLELYYLEIIVVITFWHISFQFLFSSVH